MAYTVITIHANGELVIEKLDHKPTSEWLKRRLDGGWMGVIPHFETYGTQSCVVLGDEEAKLKGLPTNSKATYLWYACLAPAAFIPDTLHGPIIILTANTAAELGEL